MSLPANHQAAHPVSTLGRGGGDTRRGCTMNVRVAALAPTTPPDTGASRTWGEDAPGDPIRLEWSAFQKESCLFIYFRRAVLNLIAQLQLRLQPLVFDTWLGRLWRSP